MAMQRLYVGADQLDRRRAVTKLGPLSARQLQNVDAATQAPTVGRGVGVCRVAFEGGAATQVVGMAVVRRRDGQRLLLWATAGGILTAQVDPQAAWSVSNYA